MAEPKDNSGKGMIAGVIGGGLAGAGIVALLSRKPAEGAPDSAKLQYIIDQLTALGLQVVDVDDLSKSILGVLREIRDKPPIDVTTAASILTPWVAKEPDKVFDQPLRGVVTFRADHMVDFRNGKRLMFHVQNNLDQAAVIQTVGSYIDSPDEVSNIGGPAGVPANGNMDIGLAWDDWRPYVGINGSIAIAATTGFLRIWAVVQE